MRSSSVCLVFAFTLVTTTAMARTIAIEQKAAADARDAHHAAETRLLEVQKKIQAQKTLIAREESRLKQLEEEENSAKADIARTSVDMEKKVKALNDAWQQRENN